MAEKCKKMPKFFKQIDTKYSSHKKDGMSVGGYGCGPTCGANIISVLTDSSVTPIACFDYVYKIGGLVPGAGSTWDSMDKMFAHWNVKSTRTISFDKVYDKVRDGNALCMCVVKSSRWTAKGHFIVLYGITNDNHVLISDPASYADYRQKQGTWKELKAACTQMWLIENVSQYKLKSNKTVNDMAKTVSLYVKEKDGVNVRVGRGTNYKKVALIKQHTKLKLDNYSGGWYRIASGKYKGKYVHGSQLSRFRYTNRKYKTMATMNIRGDAGTNNKILGQIKIGTTIISHYQCGWWAYVEKQKGVPASGWVCIAQDKGKKVYLKKVK